MQEQIEDIRQTLLECANPKIQEKMARFFKTGEQGKSYGIAAPLLNQIAKEIYNTLKSYSKKDLFQICDALWKSNFFEEAYIACFITKRKLKDFEEEDILIFEKWLSNHVSSWADCDTLCNSSIGPFLIKYPQHLLILKKWAKSHNRWERRAAAVSLVIPAKKGLFLNQIFEIADMLLLDKEDLVQKGYGWMLKEASKKNQHLVFEYVMDNKSQMPRTALRYAIEKMPEDLKIQAMKK